MNASSLSLKQSISSIYTLSFVVSLLTAITSLAGIIFQTTFYPITEVRFSSVATDMVNIFIVLPVLFWSVSMVRRDKLIGLLFWPGALFIVTYHYLAYSVAFLSLWQTTLYLLLVLLSAYTIFRLLTSMDFPAIQKQLAGKVPERFAGSVLAGFGALFFFWRGSLVMQSLTGSTALSGPEFATSLADVLFAPAWVIVGVFLWRKQAFGYATGAGLLFQFSMLFIGLFVYFALQPILAGVPFPVEDFVAVFTMSLVCFIPFGLFVRGIFKVRSNIPEKLEPG